MNQSTPSLKRHQVSGSIIEKTAKLMKLSFSRSLLTHTQIDITVDQWVVLQLVYKYQAIVQNKICKLAFKDAPTVTRIIDILTSKGLVTRVTDDHDRRKLIVKITQEGEEIYNQVLPILEAFRTEAYEGISDDELITLEAIMNKISLNLSN